MKTVYQCLSYCYLSLIRPIQKAEVRRIKDTAFTGTLNRDLICYKSLSKETFWDWGEVKKKKPKEISIYT